MKMLCRVQNISFLVVMISQAPRKVLLPSKQPPSYTYTYQKYLLKQTLSYLRKMQILNSRGTYHNCLHAVYDNSPLISSERRQEATWDRKGQGKKKQETPLFCLFHNLAWNWPWNISQMCWLRNIIWEKLKFSKTLSLVSVVFLFPSLKNNKKILFFQNVPCLK